MRLIVRPFLSTTRGIRSNAAHSVTDCDAAHSVTDCDTARCVKSCDSARCVKDCDSARSVMEFFTPRAVLQIYIRRYYTMNIWLCIRGRIGTFYHVFEEIKKNI